MNNNNKGILSAILLLVIFCIFIYFCESNAQKNAQTRINEHAEVIGDALWNYYPQGVQEYLSLACKSDNYKNLVVTDSDGKIFIESMGEKPSFSEKQLIFLGLIPEINLMSNIMQGDQIIGQINAIWKCDTIYVEIACLFVLILIFFIFKLNFRLLQSKIKLKKRVSERTDELFFSNASLQLEIEEHLQVKEALSASEERHRLITENVDDVIWSTDMDLKFTYISPSIYFLSGYTVKEAMRQSMDEMIHPESIPKIMEIFKNKINLINSGDPEGWEHIIFEIKQFTKDGSIIWTQNNARIIPDSNNEPQSILGTTRDITKNKEVERERIIALKLAAEHGKLALVGEMAGKIAHDFNNILGAIMGNTELALLDCDDAEMKKTFELIFEQTLRGKNLTKNLVTFAKDQEPKQEFLNINDKIEMITDLLRKDLDGIDLIKEKQDDLPDLLADPGMIEHALVNLIQNSIHALSKVENAKIAINTYSDDMNIFIEIEDNGCGIPEKYLDKIYEPFFTLKGSKDTRGLYKRYIKGTGYGMSNIKKYIEQHQGHISVQSELGVGTKFTISLPVVKKQLSVKDKAQLIAEKLYTEKSILLVEDEQAISDMQYRILTQEPWNHNIDVAKNGQAAIDLLNNSQYDFISLDYMLPGIINGMDVYKHIRKTNQEIPILFISGNIEFIESIKSLKQKDSMIDHLSKPCQNKDYVASINKLLGKIK